MKHLTNEIENIWQEIDELLNTGQQTFSSEKSIVFNFALKFSKIFPDGKIDFETPLFGAFSDGSYLDLLITTKNSSGIDTKIGFEFKFPKKVKHNSDRTNTRQKIINDLKRLTWLVENNRIDLGYFLCLTNELAYTKSKTYLKAPEFVTHHGKTYCLENHFPENAKFREHIKPISPINFNWRYFSNGKTLIENKIFTFLEPILISK
ncbi:MAG: hypothetical protein Q8M29_01880 [Bacteroidota bacterium]|nr:hypothetical protein [Bacteroidota bacterium]